MGGAFDEVFTDEGAPRDHAAALVAVGERGDDPPRSGDERTRLMSGA